MSYPGEKFEDDMEIFAKLAGWRVLGARKYNEDNGTPSAPCFEGENGDTTTPDLWLMKNGDTRWVECKRKEDYFTYRKEDIDQHGIDAPNWHEYRTAQKQTGDDVWLFIYEKVNRLVFAQKLDDIEITGHYSYDDYESNAAKYENEMVFFRRDSLEGVDIPKRVLKDADGLYHDYQSVMENAATKFALFPDQDYGDGSQSGLGEFADDD